jgi:phosphoribosylglycinamide formyltransferase-1
VRLAVLVSGRGSNLEAVLHAVEHGQLPAIEPILVVSNRAEVRALEIAARHRLRTQVMAAHDFSDLEARDAAIGAVLADAGVELALLAGYDQWLRASYFAAYAGRTINIHPSLLPRHGGAGMIGPAVHAAVLGSGDTETGVTIHDVTADLDAGPILLQRRVAVRKGESADQLAERVLQVEHLALVEVLSHLSARMTDLPRATTRPRR